MAVNPDSRIGSPFHLQQTADNNQLTLTFLSFPLLSLPGFPASRLSIYFIGFYHQINELNQPN